MKIAEKEEAAAVRSAAQRLPKRLKTIESGVVSVRQLREAEGKIASAEARIKTAKAAIATAQADIKIAQGKLARAKAAVKTAAARKQMAHAAMDKARIRESFTQIKAAFDGVVTRRTAEVGNFVQAGDSRLLTPLLTLQRTDRLRVVAQITDRYAPFIQLGDAVDLFVNSLPRVRIPAQHISRVRPILFRHDSVRTMRAMTVEIDVANLDGKLMPGMYGNITIHLKKKPQGGLRLPSSCLVAESDDYAEWPQEWVYVVRDGKAHKVRVQLGIRPNQAIMEVLEGVKASDLVVTNPGDLKGDNVPVEIEKSP